MRLPQPLLNKGLSRILCICLTLFVLCAHWAIAAEVPTHDYRVIRSFPHDRRAFTQGLVFADGVLYEGTGRHGRSSLRKVELATGRVLKERRLDKSFFGEGITIRGDRIVQLTWRSRVGFVYDKASFRLLQQFTYPYEGWGITHDGGRFIMSDGTPVLHILEPKEFKEIGQIFVHDDRGPVSGLNELEYVKGEIFANVWPTDRIVVIEPATGRVKARVDLAGLLDRRDAPGTDVLNGIAYDDAGDRLFVTGKLWPKVFEIKVIRGR
jgi:glutaminyl-peptide cyclotransferase